MSIANGTETSILELIFCGQSWAGFANSTGLAGLEVALHTADPTDAGDMTTNEVGYPSYRRASVGRTQSAWTVTTGSISPTANIAFPGVDAGYDGPVVSYFSIGPPGGGVQPILWSGTVTPNITLTVGVPPTLTTATVIQLD